MSLKRTQVDLEDEIRSAQAVQAPHFKNLEVEYKRACGKAWGDNDSNPEVLDDPENLRLAWTRSFMSETAQGVPRCVIDAHGVEWPEHRAYLLQEACNAHARTLNLHSSGFVARQAVEFGFRSARSVSGLIKRAGKVTPWVRELDFDELLMDATVTSRAKARWTAHYVTRDIDDVIEDGRRDKTTGWNLEFLGRVKDTLGRDPKAASKAPHHGVERNELRYWVIWEREYNLPGFDESTGHYGTLHYVLDPSMTSWMKPDESSKVKTGLVRQSESWFGSSIGPHAFSAGFKVGTLAYELSPLTALAVQSGHLNDVARAIKRAIEQYRSNGVINGDSAASLIQMAQHGADIVLPQGANIANLYGVIERGGLQPQMLTAFQLLMEQAQRASGGLYSHLGDVDSDATATAINSAATGYASTMGLYVSSYLNHYAQIYAQWAYWFDLSPDVETRVGPLPPEMVAHLNSGGVGIDPKHPFVNTKGDKGDAEKIESHRGIAMRIDAASTRGTSELTLQREVMGATQLLQTIIGLGPHAIGVDIDELQRNTARAYGAKWIEKLVDANAIRLVAGAMLGAQEAPPAPTPTAQPKTQIAPSSARPQAMGSTPATRDAKPMSSGTRQPQKAGAA
jgi:hypothetical protein